MNYLRAIVVLMLLMASKRYRLRWQMSIDQVEQIQDSVDASRNRIDALENGGKPDLRAL